MLFNWKFALAKLLRAKCIMPAAAFFLSVLPGHAAYKLDVGDVLEISVARVPELQHRVPVQLDGTISFPALGTITAAGLSPLEVQAKIQANSRDASFPGQDARWSRGRDHHRTQ